MTETTTHPTAAATRTMPLPAADIWSVLAKLDALASWAPGIEAARLTSPSEGGVGAVRDVETAQFGTITQTVTDWKPGQMFAYDTAQSGPFATTRTIYSLKDAGNGETEVTVSLAFTLAPGTLEVDHAKDMLNKGLAGTLQALERAAKSA